MISLKDVTKIYYPSKIMALDHINLDVAKGEFIVIVGRSGAGKTTLIKAINKEIEPTSGEIIFEGASLASINMTELNCFRRRIGTIFQDYRLIHTKNVFENVAYAMEVVGASDADIDRDVPSVLNMVGLKEKTHSFPQELSGGEKQRVAIARALIHRPDLILADEPTANLDVYSIQDVLESFLKINEMGTTIILATHNQNVVNYLKTRVITIENGAIVRDQQKGKFIL